jgi:hypothetical protein
MNCLPSQGFDHNGLDLHWFPQAFTPSGLPHFGASLSGLALSGIALGLAFDVVDTPGPLLFRLYHSGLRRIWTALEELHHPTGLSHFRDLSPIRGTPPVNAPNAYYKPGSFNTWAFTAQTLPQECLLCWGLVTSECFSGDFAPVASSLLPWPLGLDTPVLPPSWL